MVAAERAQPAQAAGAAAPAGSGDGNIVASLQGVLADIWNAIVSVDPRQLLISIAISFGVIVAAVIVRWVVVRLLQRLYARLMSHGEAPGEPVADLMKREAGEAEMPPGERPKLPSAVTHLLDLIIAVLAIAFIADTWGAGISALLQTGLGARIAQAAFSIGIILVLTVVAWHISGLVVTRLLVLASGSRDQERSARRLNTLVPLLRSVLQGAIGVFSALLILAQLGIDIGPLLAGAGILGLAVGFGAQTLVKDLLTGVTILLEDGATVGDVVETGGHSGVVEQMRIRIMRLRDLSGAVHLIPYSEVTTLVNYTKDFSYYLMEVGVAYREDTDEVCQVLLDLAAEMRRDAEYGPNIIDNGLEILGVDKFADSAVVIKVRLKTHAGLQWATGREFNRRMKKRFDELGIEIPFPHRTVYFGELKQGTAPPAHLTLDAADGEGLARLLPSQTQK